MRIWTLPLIGSSLLLAAGCTEPRYASTPPQVISAPAYTAVPGTYTPATAESDRALENQIHQELANGQLSYLASHVNITASNGTVTLNGSVPTAQDREALDTLARNTTGVNNVINQVRIAPAVAETSPGGSAPIYSGGTQEGPSTPTMDQSLSDRIQQTLKNNTASAPLAQNINVSVQNGVVTLTGSIPGDQQRQTVDDLVRSVSGVKSVYDRMQVIAAPTGRTAQTQEAYTGAQLPAAQNSLPGTTSMSTGDIFSLHVQGLNDTDRNLAQQILQGLRSDTTLSSMLPSVNIDVSGGRVTLQGTVETEQQKQTIGSVVQRAAGGTTVLNQLQVNSQQR